MVKRIVFLLGVTGCVSALKAGDLDWENFFLGSRSPIYIEVPKSFRKDQSTCHAPADQTSDGKVIDTEVISGLVVKHKSDWKRVVREYNMLYGDYVDVPYLKKLYKSLENPVGKGKKYSKEDDQKLWKLIQKHGFNWMEISKFFPERAPLSLRNRYYNILKYNKIPDITAEEISDGSVLTEVKEEETEVKKEKGDFSHFSKPLHLLPDIDWKMVLIKIE